MKELSIQLATAMEIPVIQRLAHEIWWPTYGGYIPHGQISTMLEEIYSSSSLVGQLDKGQQFLIVQRAGIPVGFVSFQLKPSAAHIMRIEKLYVLPSEQGKGTGKLLVNQVEKKGRLEGADCLELNVNRHNAAKAFYERQGFVTVDTIDTPYHQYMLNDYVMQKQL